MSSRVRPADEPFFVPWAPFGGALGTAGAPLTEPAGATPDEEPEPTEAPSPPEPPDAADEPDPPDADEAGIVMPAAAAALLNTEATTIGFDIDGAGDELAPAAYAVPPNSAVPPTASASTIDPRLFAIANTLPFLSAE